MDEVNKYVIDENGVSAILMLDVRTNPRLSTAISMNCLLQNWKEDTRIHLTGNFGTALYLGMNFDGESTIDEEPIKVLKHK